MSIYSIMQFNAAHNQMVQNSQDQANLEAKRTQTETAQQELDLNKQLQESKVKIANNQGKISDWSTKQILDGINEQHKPISDAFDATSQLQDLTAHKLQQQGQQAQQVAQKATQDPDVQNFMANMMGKGGNQQGDGIVPPTAPSPTGNPAMNAINPMTAPQSTVQDSLSPLTASIMPSMNTTPGVATPQGGASPENVNAQVQAPVGAADASSPTMPAPQASAQMQAPTAQSMAQDTAQPFQTPQGLSPISDRMASMDNIPFGDQSAGIRDTQMPNPNYKFQLAMGDKEAKPYIPATADIINARNPLHLSPAQQKLVEHVPNLLSQGYSKEEILNNLPHTLAANLKSIGQDYTKPLSQYMQRANSDYRNEFSGLLTELYPNYNENNYVTRADLMKKMNNTSPGSMGGQILSTNAMAAHLGELYQRAQTMQNGNIPVGNAIINFVKQNLGHPEVNDFNAAKEIFTNELQRLLSGKAATQGGNKETASTLSANSSPAQLMTVLKTYANAAVEKMNPLRTLYSNTMGEDENGKVVYPQTRKILNGIIGTDKFKEFDSNGGNEQAGGQQTQIPDGRVQVTSPDGKIGHIPKEQLQAALKAGYTQ